MASEVSSHDDVGSNTIGRPPAAKKARAWSFSRRMRSASDLHDDAGISELQREIIKKLLTAGDPKVISALDAWGEGDRTPIHSLIRSGHIATEKVPPSDNGAALASTLGAALQFGVKNSRRNTSVGSLGDFLAHEPSSIEGIGLGVGPTAAEGTVRQDEPVQPMDSVLAQSLLSTWPQLKMQALGLDKLPKQDAVNAAIQRLAGQSGGAATKGTGEVPAPAAPHGMDESIVSTSSGPTAPRPSHKLVGPHHLQQFANARKTSMAAPPQPSLKRPRGHSNPLSLSALGMGSFDFHDNLDAGAMGSFDMGRPPSVASNAFGTPTLAGQAISTGDPPRARLGSFGAMFSQSPYDAGTGSFSVGGAQPGSGLHDSGMFLPSGSPSLGPTFGAGANNPARARLLSDLEMPMSAGGVPQTLGGSADASFQQTTGYQYRPASMSFGLSGGGVDSTYTGDGDQTTDAGMDPESMQHYSFPSGDHHGDLGGGPGRSRNNSTADRPSARVSNRLREKAQKRPSADEIGLLHPGQSSAQMGLLSSTGPVDLWADADDTGSGGLGANLYGSGGYGNTEEDVWAEPAPAEIESGRKRLSAIRQMANLRAAAAVKSRTPRQASMAAAAMTTRGVVSSLSKRNPYGDDDRTTGVETNLPNVTVRTIGGVEVPVVERMDGYIGAYTIDERQKRLQRFMEKRAARIWHKNIKYEVRKNFADSRLRVKGRFVPKDHEQLLREFMMMI